MKAKILLDADQAKELVARLETFPLSEIRPLLGVITDQIQSQMHILEQFEDELEEFIATWEYKPKEQFYGSSLADLLRKATEAFDEQNAKRTDEFVKKAPAKKRGRPAAKKRVVRK